MMRHTIMTEKIIRRGVRVPADYSVDYLDRVTVGEVCSRNVVTLAATQRVTEVRDWLDTRSPETQHQGFPVRNADGHVIGVVTRKDLSNTHQPADTCIGDLIRRVPLIVEESHSAREAADHMVEANVGRLIVVADNDAGNMIGIVTRGDLLAAHSQRLKEARQLNRHLTTPFHPTPDAS
jgi:predicted transcriptional regulator